MVNILSILQPHSLRTRLTLWFLLIALIPLIWTTFISYEFAKKILIHQATENLQALSLRQAQLIENYFKEKEKTAASLARGESFPHALNDFNKALRTHGKESAEYKALEKEFRPVLDFRTEMLGYSNLLLVSKEGEIVFSAKPSKIIGTNLYTEAYQGSQLQKSFEEAKDLLQTKLSNFSFYHPQESPAAFISAPLLEDRHLAGVVIVQINMSTIYNLIKDYSGLGKTGETLLVSEIDSQLISLAPLRYEHMLPPAELGPIRIIPLQTDLGHFVKNVLDGKRLVDTLPDYRGEETLMVGRYLLPALHWAVITKMDSKELLAPIQRLKTFSVILALITAGIVTLIATYVANTIANPISVLTEKTRLMAEGNLSQRIDAQWSDEFGSLANSFNYMASQLDGIIKHLDTIVAKRTEEVEKQNDQLEHTIDELQEAQNRLITQEKLASLGALTAGIAHEIKNPLNFINNFAELSLQVDQDMEEKVENIKNQIPIEDSEALHNYLETLKLNIGKIYEHGKRADSIVRNMLQHSRGVPGERVLTDVNALLDEYIALSYHGMRALDPSFNVKIEKDYYEAIPKILLVPQEISRVFLNILNNAYYSVNQKKKESSNDYNPIVKISTDYLNNLVIIKIWDNGKGIAPDTFPKLFTPFFTTKPSGEGTGLGLSLSYNIIVQGHQGTLTANGEEDKFAEFIITLPAKTKD